MGIDFLRRGGSDVVLRSLNLTPVTVIVAQNEPEYKAKSTSV